MNRTLVEGKILVCDPEGPEWDGITYMDDIEEFLSLNTNGVILHEDTFNVTPIYAFPGVSLGDDSYKLLKSYMISDKYGQFS